MSVKQFIKIALFLTAVVFVVSCKQPFPGIEVNNPERAELSVSFETGRTHHQLAVVTLEVLIENTSEYQSDVSYLEFFLVSGGVRTELLASPVKIRKIPGRDFVVQEVLFVIPDTLTGDVLLQGNLVFRDDIANSCFSSITISDKPLEKEPNNNRFDESHEVVLNQGYGGSFPTESDEDWFVLTLLPLDKIAVSADGSSALLILDFYTDSEGTAFKQFIGDDFSEEVIIENSLDRSRTLYIRATSQHSQNYSILFRRLVNDN